MILSKIQRSVSKHSEKGKGGKQQSHSVLKVDLCVFAYVCVCVFKSTHTHTFNSRRIGSGLTK